jgi:hypothetical protein
VPGLAAFEPPPEYALVMKVASLPATVPPRALDDLRFLLRALNLGTPQEAMAVVERYVAYRHVPPHAQEVLRSVAS